MKRILTSVLLLLAVSLVLKAQHISDLVLTEVVVDNENGLLDENGRHSPWVEITNSSQGSVSVGGCYLSDDPGNLKKFMVPKGDLKMKLGARQVMVLHPDFPLVKGSTLYLVSTDGKTIVDSIDIPSDLPVDRSVRKLAKDAKKVLFITEAEDAAPTPGKMNSDRQEESGAEKMARTDRYGGVLTLTSITVVFGALLILLIIFSITGGFFSGKFKRSKTPSDEEAAAIALALDMEQDGDIYAAIAAAVELYLSDSVHDVESYRLTIRQGEGSAWRDKRLTFRKLPK